MRASRSPRIGSRCGVWKHNSGDYLHADNQDALLTTWIVALHLGWTLLQDLDIPGRVSSADTLQRQHQYMRRAWRPSSRIMLWTFRSRALGALILEYVVGELFRLPKCARTTARSIGYSSKRPPRRKCSHVVSHAGCSRCTCHGTGARKTSRLRVSRGRRRSIQTLADGVAIFSRQYFVRLAYLLPPSRGQLHL